MIDLIDVIHVIDLRNVIALFDVLMDL